MAQQAGTNRAGRAAAEPDEPTMTFRMRQIVQLLADGVLLVDRNGLIVAVNGVATDILERPEQALVGVEVEQLLLGAGRDDGRPFLVEDLPVRRALLSGVPQTGVAMGFARSGRPTRWLEVDAIPLGTVEQDGAVVLVSFRDVTEHRQADEAVRFQARLLDAAAEAIIATDRQLRITYCNAGTETLLRQTRDETVGAPASALFAPDRAEDFERIEHLLGAGLVIRDFETVLRRADGTEVDVSVSVSSQTTASGDPDGAIAIVRDITERVRVEREAAANAARAAEAEREVMRAAVERAAADRANEAKTELLSRVSHELRTPLNSVLGFAQLLDDAELEDPLDRRSVAQILQAGRRLVEITDDVVEFARATDESRRTVRARRDERDLTILFVDDDPSHLRALEAVVEDRDQVNLVTTTEGRRGLELAREIRPDLLLLSASLSDLATRDALAQLRADGAMESTWVVVVGDLDGPALVDDDDEAGAEDGGSPMDLVRLVQLVEGLASDPSTPTAA